MTNRTKDDQRIEGSRITHDTTHRLGKIKDLTLKQDPIRSDLFRYFFNFYVYVRLPSSGESIELLCKAKSEVALVAYVKYNSANVC